MSLFVLTKSLPFARSEHLLAGPYSEGDPLQPLQVLQGSLRPVLGTQSAPLHSTAQQHAAIPGFPSPTVPSGSAPGSLT